MAGLVECMLLMCMFQPHEAKPTLSLSLLLAATLSLTSAIFLPALPSLVSLLFSCFWQTVKATYLSLSSAGHAHNAGGP
jgi:hypothetical protein